MDATFGSRAFYPFDRKRGVRLRISAVLHHAAGRPYSLGRWVLLRKQHRCRRLQLYDHRRLFRSRLRPPPPTYYYNTCTWDLYGNLLSTIAGAPVQPAPLYTVGTETVYASGFSTTGHDSRNFGFVATPSSHYSWQSNGGYADISDAPYMVQATLTSDGDYVLNVSNAVVTPQIYGTVTPNAGNATITGNTCQAVWPGATCTITVRYDPTAIMCTSRRTATPTRGSIFH